MNHEAKGKAENLKGRVKQAVGAVTGNKKLEAEGAADRATGAAEHAAGKAARKLEGAAEDAGDRARRDEAEDEAALDARERDGRRGHA
jgi:uncharacterized protein YjbJ (UPF0337 family)